MGIIKAIIPCNLPIKLPFLKSTPLVAWAFIIVPASTTKLGTNLMAMVIIIAHSEIGIFKNFSGAKILSIPKANWIEVVVIVKIVIIVIIKKIFKVTFKVTNTTSGVKEYQVVW